MPETTPEPAAPSPPTEAKPTVTGHEEPGAVQLFRPTPAIIRFFDGSEEAIRSRLSKVSLFRKLFQLERDWMTRITMLMVVLSVFWGIVGATDIVLWRLGVTWFALGQPVDLSNQELYSALTLHGIRMLFGFAQQLELALFGIIFVTAFGIAPTHKWAYYLSVVLLNLGILFMEGPFYLLPQFNDNYFPALGWYFYSPLGIRGLSSYVASPLWYVGWILLCVAVMIWAVWMLLHFLTWWNAHKGQTRRLPPFALFVIALVILIPLSYVFVLASSAWDLANYFGAGPVDPLLNQVVFWFFGHGIVYILFLIPITAFYFLIPIFAKRPIYSYRAAFAAAVIFTILTPVLSIHHLYLTPVPPWSAWLTMALTFLIIIPSAITFFTLWMTLKGVRKQDWQWNAATLFLLLSFAGTFAGGLTGPDNNSIGFDIDLHNTLFIVSHFHTLALLSITAGGFAVVYAAFPLLAGRLWYSPRLAQSHFIATAIGWSGLVFYMDLLGSEGILRRSLIYPLTGGVVGDQVMTTAFAFLSIVAQVPFAINVVLTVFKGEVLTVQGLSLDEIIRKMAQSTHPKPTVSIRDVPFVRTVPRARRESVEKAWITVVIVLIVGVLAITSPIAYDDSSMISTPSSPPAGSEYVSLVGHQYYWSVQENGPIRGSYDDVIVAHANQWVAINATAVGATQGFYLPFRNLPTVDVQVIPGATSYWLFQAPSVPGVYGSPDSEYDGPWFGQDAAALVVLPTANTTTGLSQFVSDSAEGDVYSPPVWSATSPLVADGEGLFNHSVPGPTLTAAPGAVSLRTEVPMSSIGIDDYLVNVTTNAANGQQTYVQQHNDTLPYPIGLYAINTTGGGLTPIVQMPLKIGSWQTESATLPTGVYVYGLTSPVDWQYDPDGQSGFMTGSQTGQVMGLWGILWVSP